MLNKQEALGSSHVMFNSMRAKSSLGLLMSNRLWKPHWLGTGHRAGGGSALLYQLPHTSSSHTATSQCRWPYGFCEDSLYSEQCFLKK